MVDEKTNPQTVSGSVTGGGDTDLYVVPDEVGTRVLYYIEINHANSGQVVTLSTTSQTKKITCPNSGVATPVTIGGNSKDDELLHLGSGETLNIDVDGGDIDYVIGSADK